VTISQIESNVNSTVVITDGDSSDIVGYNPLTVEEMKSKDKISLNTSNLGGKIEVYLIPSENISISRDRIDTTLSDQEKKSAADKESAHVYLGTVEFKNQEYREGRAANISVATSEVRDTIGMETPYIISIHPITSNNNIVYDEYIGYSDILFGVNSGVKIPVRDANGNESRIWRSNQYVATIRLAKGQELGTPVNLTSTKRLPNSDIKNQFVKGDVSDSANIRIANLPSEKNNGSRLDREFNSTNYTGKQLYSGEVVLFNNSSSSKESVKLHRIVTDNTSKVAGLGTYLNDTGGVLFNTTGLRTGRYSLIGGGFERKNQFKLIGSGDQRINFSEVKKETSIGERANYVLYHHTPRVSIEISDAYTNTTIATANLSTPSSGRTSIGLNTYALGNESLTDGIVTAGPGATVESVDTSMSNGTLPPGEYRIEVRSAQGLAETSDETTVTVGSRSTNGLNAYATTALDRDALGTAGAVRRAIANGTLSPTSTVRPDETVVYVANATGLTGLPAARNATAVTGADLARLDGLAFGVRSNASALSTATGDDRTGAVGAVPTNSSVHVDDEGLYLVADGDDALATDETPADGETFTAEFRVTDERLREVASDPASDHNASTTLTFEVPPPDGDSEGGDSKGDDTEGSDSLGAGNSGGGTGGGAPVGDAAGGGTGSGGAPTGSGGATGGRPTGSLPETGSPSSGTTVETQRDAIGTGPRSDLRVSGGRFGIRPLADVRPIARENLTGSPASVSRTSVPADTGAAPSGGEPARSETGTDRGGAGTAGADTGSDEAAADEATGTDEAAGTNAADSRSRAGDDSTRKSTEKSDAGPETPSYDDAPIRTTADDVPGFGPLATVIALLLAGRLAARRRGREP